MSEIKLEIVLTVSTFFIWNVTILRLCKRNLIATAMNEKVARSRFHQHFTCKFFVRKFVQSQTLSREKRLKRLLYQKWWNWRQGLISPTFYEQLLCAKIPKEQKHTHDFGISTFYEQLLCWFPFEKKITKPNCNKRKAL